MSAVCGKRSFLDDLQSPSPTTSSSSSPVTKKLRCFSSTSPVRFSHSPPPQPSLIDRLVAAFPDMDKELLEKRLEEFDHDLDFAIKYLNELRLGYVVDAHANMKNADDVGNCRFKHRPRHNFLVWHIIWLNIYGILCVTTSDGEEAAPPEDASTQGNLPVDGAEWVELFVREMMSASSIDDASSRATRVLESLERSISARAGAEAAEIFHKENIILREQIEVHIRENSILKRAVAIQHERQKEYDDKNQEVQHLKQLVAQYQEQLRTLEVNNYALRMHLQQAQQGNSIPGRFNPNIF